MKPHEHGFQPLGLLIAIIVSASPAMAQTGLSNENLGDFRLQLENENNVRFLAKKNAIATGFVNADREADIDQEEDSLEIESTTKLNQPEVVRWIKNAATVISSKRKEFGDFEKQASAVRVVGLGEATHGQHEAFELKRQLTMHLIRNHGFRVVAYEASASQAIDCDAYVSGRTDDRRKAIAGLGMLIWQVEENGKLLDDLRSWNLSCKPDDRVRFIGCDAQNGQVIVKRIATLLGEKNVAESKILSTLLLRSENAIKKAHEGHHGELEKLLADAKSQANKIRKLATNQSLDVVEVDLRLMEFVAHLGLYRDAGARDKAMAELLLSQLDRSRPNDKCVFWGHNAHVQRSPMTYMGSDALAMGGHLAEALGQDYYALGFAFGEGEFQANVVDDSGKWLFRRYSHSAAPKGSLDAFLAEAMDQDFLLDFRSASSSKEIQSWLNSNQGHRWWGGYNVPEDFEQQTSDADNLSQCKPGKDFDGLAFHHQTTAAQPVDAGLILSSPNDNSNKNALKQSDNEIDDKNPTKTESLQELGNQPNSKQIFENLKQLVGTWEGEEKTGKQSVIEYSLTSNDSVLVEHWYFPSGRDAMTLYHLDGDRMLATHYCPKANQSRLELMKQSDNGTLEFELESVTNLRRPGASHQSKFQIRFNGTDRLWRSEVYLTDGEESNGFDNYHRIQKRDNKID